MGNTSAKGQTKVSINLVVKRKDGTREVITPKVKVNKNLLKKFINKIKQK